MTVWACRRGRIGLGMGIVVAGGLWAALAPGALAQDRFGLAADGPINVGADACDVFEAEGRVVCTGSVRVVQGEGILVAANMTVFGADGGGFDRMIAEGDVRYSNGENAVSSQRGVYDAAAQTITMTGDVVVVQGTQVMTGGVLVYHTDTRKMVFTPDEGERVRGLFQTGATE